MADMALEKSPPLPGGERNHVSLNRSETFTLFYRYGFMRFGLLAVVVYLCCSFGTKELFVADQENQKWDSVTLAKAAAAARDTCMTQTEQEVIYYCNLARLEPKKFADTYAREYIKNKIVRETGYTKSLIRDLKKTKPMHVLHANCGLYHAAFDHAVKSGKRGTIGHQNLAKRIKKFAPSKKNLYGENCDYGNAEALDIVMSLLIDEGISDLGHRKNILSREYGSVGVSIQPHKKFKINAVMDFGM